MDTPILNVSTRDSRKCLFKWTEQYDKENNVEQSVTPLVSPLEIYYACLDVNACIISISCTCMLIVKHVHAIYNFTVISIYLHHEYSSFIICSS